MTPCARPVLIFLLSLSVVFSGCSHARVGLAENQGPPAWLTAPEAAPGADVKDQIGTPIFAFGPTGFLGVISTGEMTFTRIISRPDAAACMKQVLADGSSAGRAYALIALRELDPDYYRAHYPEALARPALQIMTLSGCLIGQIEAEKLYAEIDQGVYRNDFLAALARSRREPAPVRG